MPPEYGRMNYYNTVPVGSYELSKYPPKQPNLDFGELPVKAWPDQWRPNDRFSTPQAASGNQLKQALDASSSFHPLQHGYRLGESELPVAPYREYMLQTIAEHQRTILSSETGSGKSSQTGLYLLEDGYPRIFVTQPRILAARDLYERARFNLGPQYEHLAGYLTGNAKDSDCGPDARLIYVTEELLFKMANRGNLRPDDVIIPDEAHERTEPMVFLLGIMKEILPDNPDMRLMVSSATIDTEKFAQNLSHPTTRQPAPILTLPGRTHPIKDIMISRETVTTAARQAMRNGENVLVFEPGIKRQKETAAKMASRMGQESVHLLYGDQTPTEQKKALNPEDHNHIVSNRIGETSITPVNKSVVIDSGLSNIGIYEAGKRVLKTVASSQATMTQRRGRVGRTSPGTYVVAVPSDAPPQPAFEDREPYDIPPIEVSSVAGYLAELLAADRRIEELDLIERPTTENLQHDYRVLRRLGAVVVRDSGLQLTEVGRQMIDLPLDASLARMVVEARSIDQHYDVDVNQVRVQVAAAAAIRQVKGILDSSGGSKARYHLSLRPKQYMSDEKSSDMLFELDAFIHLLEIQQQYESRDPSTATERFEKYMLDKDIAANRYYKAYRNLEELCRRERLEIGMLCKPDVIERQAIIGCQIAGADEIFVRASKTVHYDIRGEKRQLGRRSNVDGAYAGLVIGTAFDYRGLRETGNFEKRYIVGASGVNTNDLLRHAPHRITSKRLDHVVGPDGAILQRQVLYFDDEIMFDEIYDKPAATFETREFIIRAMMTGVALGQQGGSTEYASRTPNARRAIEQWDVAMEYEHRSLVNLRVKERYDKLINRIVRESVDKVPLDVTDPKKLDMVIPKVYQRSLVRPSRVRDIPEILQKSPDSIAVSAHEDHREWLEISYRRGVAYISVPVELKYTIQRSDFAELEQHRHIKLKLGKNGTINQIDKFFEIIEEHRNSPKRLKRLERRAATEAAAREERTPDTYEMAIQRTKRIAQKPLELSQTAPVIVRPQVTRLNRYRQPRGNDDDRKDS